MRSQHPGSRSLAFILLSATLLLCGCGKNKQRVEQLNEQIVQQQQEIQRRQSAAEICEDLFEAEQQRYVELERLTRMQFVEPLKAPVLDQVTLDALPEETRQQVQEQILGYQVKISDQVGELVILNKALQEQIAGVGLSVNREASALRKAGIQQTQELRSEIVASSQKIGHYLERGQELSGRIETLIRDVQRFDQEVINCSDCWGRDLRKAAVRESKQRRLQVFSDQLVEDLARLQSLSHSAGGN